ncbi:hypothetical protein [Amycolatopsis pittospori]|uniref:hypothetical protein n=1 Tax=Amycolatopsis pittospori TaxID=2749434 RepID=UPI0015EFE0E9|nr:hypothetical protein [Amycolatopsis pittospori]
MTDWVAEPSSRFTALVGERIEAWAGVEMALRENVAGNGPQFTDPDVPCLQLLELQARVGTDTSLSVGTYQNNDLFGLYCRPASEFRDAEHWDGIYRWRSLPELPTGLVERVAVFSDEDVLAEAHLRIGGRPLVLLAGELEEHYTGELIFQRLDESVLAFLDPAAADRLPWNTSREGCVEYASV